MPSPTPRWPGKGTRSGGSGPERELPAAYATAERLDAGGGLVIPGLVDCHTHLAFGGWRADEFEQRIVGRSYLDIAARRRRDRADRAAHPRGEPTTSCSSARRGFLREMCALGVTTVECKSGYGLDREHELGLLRVYRRLAERQPVRLVPTFLGAHVVPPEFRDDRAGYLALLIDELIPRSRASGWRAFCDVFVERVGVHRGGGPAICSRAARARGTAAPSCTPIS